MSIVITERLAEEIFTTNLNSFFSLLLVFIPFRNINIYISFLLKNGVIEWMSNFLTVYQQKQQMV